MAEPGRVLAFLCAARRVRRNVRRISHGVRRMDKNVRRVWNHRVDV